MVGMERSHHPIPPAEVRGVIAAEGLMMLIVMNDAAVERSVHHPQDPRKRRQRLDAGIPRLCLERGGKLVSLQVPMSGILQPAIRFDDLERIGRGHQDLCKQGVRIKRDRGEQESGCGSGA